MKKKRWPLVLLALAMVLVAFRYVKAEYFGPMTCGSGEAEMVRYIEDRYDRDITVCKTAREGRLQAVLYQEHDFGERYIMIFERRLLGLRLRQTGMNTWNEGGLHRSGSWSANGRCEIQIYGDNRDGRVEGYHMADAPAVARDELEAGYILDLYILDGIDHLPRELVQTPAG